METQNLGRMKVWGCALLICLLVGSSVAFKRLTEYDKYQKYIKSHKVRRNYFLLLQPSKEIGHEPADLGVINELPGPRGKVTLAEMKRMLGQVDSKYLSVERPLESITRPNGTLYYDVPSLKSVGPMTFTLPAELRGRGLHARVRRGRLKRKLRRFLAVYTSCPVLYRWTDRGDRFWPRWVRTGSCPAARSCSLPPGMACKQHKARHVRLLWRDCRRRDVIKSRDVRGRCPWITVHYPVVTACKCVCR